MEPKDSLEKLMELAEAHCLYHVKTLNHDDAQGVLRWMGAAHVKHFDRPSPGEGIVPWLIRLCDQNGVNREKLEITHIGAVPKMEGKERLVVCLERWRDNATGFGHCGSLVLFAVMAHSFTRTPCSRPAISLCNTVRRKLGVTRALFAEFKRRIILPMKPSKQSTIPVLNGFVPGSYDTVQPKIPLTTADGFGRMHVKENPTATSSQWTLYEAVNEVLPNHAQTHPASARGGEEEGSVDIESLLREPCTVLGKGGFGVTVRIADNMVAKVNLFPEMLNWSMPFVADEFKRYAHVASQIEEILIGVSMKHPNVLRTFGGFWCESPGYQLGGRAVSILEMAVCSLHEFFLIMEDDTGYVPLVELDTLAGLDYLRRRGIQHRDITHRNILVCHANNREPLPVVFKISDFGTACNFSTPDQPRGTRTNKPPELMWCLEADTSMDVFSWYCVMWELHSGTPLIGYRSDTPGFCKKTYARNLSELVGVYTPQNPDAFQSEYMKSIDAEDLFARYGNSRPSSSTILSKLSEMAKSSKRPVTDLEFVALGSLCITLFPQERPSPSQLLSLPRYCALKKDVTTAAVPVAKIPPSMSAGEYVTTDIIASEDCVPRALAERAKVAQVTTYKQGVKKFYGIDVIRLVPERIQPYDWYSRKVACFTPSRGCGQAAAKRKACMQLEGPHEVRRAKAHSPFGAATGSLSNSIQPPEQDLSRATPSDQMNSRSTVTLQSEHGDVVARSAENEDSNKDTPAPPPFGKRTQKTKHCQGDSETMDYAGILLSESASVLESSELERGAPRGQGAVALTEEPMSGQIVLKARKHMVEGEIETGIAILMQGNRYEAAMFRKNVVELSQALVEKRPDLFAGPIRGMCASSASEGVFVFQYASLLRDHVPAPNWTPLMPPHSNEKFAVQVFLLLREALLSKMLPVHALDLKNVLICQGAAVIDAVGYLSKHFRGSEPIAGHRGKAALVDFCLDIVNKYLPGTALGALFRRRRDEGDQGDDPTDALVTTLDVAITELKACAEDRIPVPRRLTLDQGYFTFKEYTAEIPTWSTERDPGSRCGARLLVYGTPPCIRGDQTRNPESILKNRVFKALIRNLMLRMRTKVFGRSRVEVTALNCTSEPLKVTVNRSALTRVAGLSKLNLEKLQLCQQGKCYTHDANPNLPIDSLMWAPIIMFTKHSRTGPVTELEVKYYKIIIMLVLLNSQKSSSTSLIGLFDNVCKLCGTDCTF